VASREEHAESKGEREKRLVRGTNRPANARDAPRDGQSPAKREGDERSRLQNASPLTSVESPDFKMKIDSPSARHKYGFAQGPAFAGR